MMNKKELKEFNDAKKEVFVARALNWSDKVTFDLPSPKEGETRGFVYNIYNRSIMHALSNSVHHATSFIDGEPPKKTSSQNPIPMYSTKLLALKALRHAMERSYAENLAAIDMQIAEEMSAQ